MYRARLNSASLLICSILLIASQKAAAQAGHLDPTFGNGGIVTTDFGPQSNSNFASANGVAIQPDGKILVCGGVPGKNGFPVAAVARYNTNGSLDAAFGSSGIVSTPSIEDVPFTSITLQTDGKILAVAGGFTAFVARYTSSGVLDSTFGTGGIVTLQFINGPAASGVVVQPDGNILVANNYLFRLLPGGQFDTSFGTGGAARAAGYQATGLALLPNGKIVTTSSEIASGFLSQYDSNGSLDTTFGIGGQLASPGTGPGLVLLSNGEFLSDGSQTNNSVQPANGFTASGFVISRYLAAGVTDASFGTNGGTVTYIPNYPNVATSNLAVQPSGDIVTLGTASHSSQTAFALARYTANGQLDGTFGTNGTVVTSFGLGAFNISVNANGLAVQPDGKIVAAGGYSYTLPHGLFDAGFKVVRYLGQ